MKLHPDHKEILEEIKARSGKPTQHTFLETYLGNHHPRYPISSPVLRKIAKEWMRNHKELSSDDFTAVLTSLISGETFTEKCIAGFMLGYATEAQRNFKINIFNSWLDQLEGWAEIDVLCTGKYALIQIPLHFSKWKPFLHRLSKDKSIVKRRASIVFFCSPISHCQEEDVADTALEIIDRLKHEKEILITKAISWLLRSMIRHHRNKVELFIQTKKTLLPAIAVRETLKKLKTGKKG